MARSRKNKGRVKPKGKSKGSKKTGFVPQFHHNQQTRIGGRYNGILEITQKGYGFIRRIDFEFSFDPKDPFLKPEEVKHHDLRSGLVLEGEFEQDQSGNRHVHSIERINGKPAEQWQRVSRFELQTPIMPNEYIKLGYQADDIELRVIDCNTHRTRAAGTDSSTTQNR